MKCGLYKYVILIFQHLKLTVGFGSEKKTELEPIKFFHDVRVEFPRVNIGKSFVLLLHNS